MQSAGRFLSRLLLLLAVFWSERGACSQSFGSAELFTDQQFNLSRSTVVFSPSNTADGGYSTCLSPFELTNTSSAKALQFNDSSFAQYDLGTARFPFQGRSQQYIYVHALGFLTFTQPDAEAADACTQPDSFFSTQRISAFCTGAEEVSSLEASVLQTPDSLTVEWVLPWQPCPVPSPPSVPQSELAPGLSAGQRFYSGARSQAYPVVVQAQLKFTGEVSLSLEYARPCSVTVGLSTGLMPQSSTPLALAPACDAPAASLRNSPSSARAPSPAPLEFADFLPLAEQSVPSAAALPNGCSPVASGSLSVNGSAFRQNGTNYLGYGSYACRAPTLKYLPSALPQISLVSGQAVTKPLLISNGFGDSSWGGNASASSSGGQGGRRRLLQPAPSTADLTFSIDVEQLSSGSTVTPWLIVNGSQVTLAPGAVANVPVTFNASRTTPGQYSAVLRIASNDPFTPTVSLTAYLNSFCGRFPLAAPNLTTPQVMFKALNQTLPPEWQDAPLPNDPFGISWVYYEAEVVATSPVAALSRDNLNPQSDAGTGVVFSIDPAQDYGILCGAWQVRGAYPLKGFFDATSTQVNLTVSGLVDIYNRTQPAANASTTVQHWPVCELYGVDMGVSSDFGAVSQRDKALIVMGCSKPLERFNSSCLSVQSSQHPTNVPVPTYTSAVAGSPGFYQAVLSWHLGWYGGVSVSLSPGCNATDDAGQALADFAPFNFTVVHTALVSPMVYRLGEPYASSGQPQSFAVPFPAQPLVSEFSL